LCTGWPDDPETVEEANVHPEVFAHKTVKQVADHFDDVISKLTTRCRCSPTSRPSWRTRHDNPNPEVGLQ